MIITFQDELYLLERKQAKGTRIRANIRWDLEGEKFSKTFCKVLKRQNMQNQTISELYTDAKRSKFSRNLNHILQSAKNFYENLYTRGNVSKSAIDELLNKIPTNKKISNEHFNLCEAEISLDEIIKGTNSKKK